MNAALHPVASGPMSRRRKGKSARTLRLARCRAAQRAAPADRVARCEALLVAVLEVFRNADVMYDAQQHDKIMAGITATVGASAMAAHGASQ